MESGRSGRDRLACVLGEGVRHKGVRVAMPHAMFLLEPGDMLHVLSGRPGTKHCLPLGDGPTVLLLDGRKIGGGSLDVIVAHELESIEAR